MNDVAEERTGHAAVVRDRAGTSVQSLRGRLVLMG
jgi:hypothetical protein